MVGAGKTEGSMDAANLLKPMLARGELHCIGATTLMNIVNTLKKMRLWSVVSKEYKCARTKRRRYHISILRGLKDRFERIMVYDSG